MAERRMFAKTIIDSDAFLEMPVTSRLLYYDLAMRADDDGFNNSPKKIMKIIGATEDDLRILIARKFIIPFDNGVVVIKHWRIHNYIRKDTYKETQYKEEKELLEYDENNAYRLADNLTSISDSTSRQQAVDEPSTQVRLGKDSIGKDRLGEDRKGKKAVPAYYPNDEKLNAAFADYVDMRKKIKAPMTDRAVTLAMNKLAELSGGDNDLAIDILNQSVMNSWKGLFELKKANKPSSNSLDDWANA